MLPSSTQHRVWGTTSLPEMGETCKHTCGQNHERKHQFRQRVHGRYLWIQLCVLLIFMVCGGGRALEVEYCSNVNTGSSYSAATEMFQSHGLCYDTCKAKYAFAVVQGLRCWCSDYVPASTTTGCDEICPGYGSESCGNTKKGLYGYISLPNAPKGTAGGSSTTTSQSTSSSSMTSSPTSTSAQSTSTGATSTPSVSIVTSVGGYKTVTLAPTEQTPAPTQRVPTSDSSNGNFFSKPGRVAGLFVGLALGIILIVAALLFLCYRRNRQRATFNSVGSGSATMAAVAGGGVFSGRRRSRSLSTLGLIGEKGGTAMNTTPTSTANNFSGLPTVEAGKSATTAQTPGRLIDQRLDPNQIYLRYDPDTGSSRMSVRSLRDDTDYSRRVLRDLALTSVSSLQIPTTNQPQAFIEKKRFCIHVMNLGTFCSKLGSRWLKRGA
ncbi:unnamed protein product [Tuber aestivum]|uniref:WSC domain-containing protein n=1 Tax=Tuber aestivum TaxID=59557 RepID=A0A292Q2Z5_9PEZI|nr:unnamed protein product [Tuber aestivum]